MCQAVSDIALLQPGIDVQTVKLFKTIQPVPHRPSLVWIIQPTHGGRDQALSHRVLKLGKPIQDLIAQAAQTRVGFQLNVAGGRAGMPFSQRRIERGPVAVALPGG